MNVITTREIDVAHWQRLRARNPALASPFFSPEFTLAVAGARADVHIAVDEDTIFPFHVDEDGACAPVGGILSDHHGAIGVSVDWSEVFAAARMQSWRFDHLVASQAPPDAVALRVTSSPGLDLRGGFASWVERRVRAGSRQIAETERKARKLAREIGPLRFEVRTRDAGVLDAVFAWKSAQCRSTGVRDFFSWGWTRELVSRVASTRSETFGGAVSALWAGDALVAAHMGMHSENVWHWWFPVYDHVYARYSPGAILLLRLAEAAADEGKVLLDLGKGGEDYKARFSDFDTPIAEGFIARRSIAGAMLGARVQVESWLRSSALFDPLRPAVRRVRRWTTPATS